MQEITKKTESYRRLFNKYGVTPKSLAGTTKGQTLRFQELIKDLSFEGKTVLDFGCGFGDIVPYISDKSNSFEYLGVDIVPEFIEVASKLYKTRNINEQENNIKFLNRNILDKPLNKKFDIVMSSGALNSNLTDALRYRKKVIKILWRQTKEALAFNMAGNFPQPETKKSYRVWYAHSMEVLEFCFSLTSKIIFRHQYHKKDFTLILFK